MKSYLNIFIFLILIQSFQSIEEDLVIESKALGAELTSLKYNITFFNFETLLYDDSTKLKTKEIIEFL